MGRAVSNRALCFTAIAALTLSACDEVLAPRGTVTLTVSTELAGDLDEMPATYTAFVTDLSGLSDNTAEAPIAANGSVDFTDLGVGLLLEVGVRDLPPPCRGRGGSERPTRTGVQIPSEGHLDLELEVVCWLGRLDVRVGLEGTDLDPDGYEVVLDGTRAIPVAGPDADVEFDRVAPGAHEVSIRGLAPNCVAAASPASTTVPFMVDGLVTLTAICTPLDATGGSLVVDVAGLPDGLDAAVTVTGDGGFSAVVTETTTFTDLEAGSYWVDAAEVSGTPWRFRPEMPAQVHLVAADTTAIAPVLYTGYTDELLVDASFEGDTVVVSGNVYVEDLWFGDSAIAVDLVDGIAPLDGTRMLQFRTTTAGGPSATWTGSERFQIVDVRGFEDEIGDGVVGFDFSAAVNRVVGDAETDDEFALRVWAYSGDPTTYETQLVAGSALFDWSLSAGSAPQLWQLLELLSIDTAAQRRLPPETTFLVVSVLAIENQTNDGDDPEFDGHFVDDARLVLTLLLDR